jgi:hypothetical protein
MIGALNVKTALDGKQATLSSGSNLSVNNVTANGALKIGTLDVKTALDGKQATLDSDSTLILNRVYAHDALYIGQSPPLDIKTALDGKQATLNSTSNLSVNDVTARGALKIGDAKIGNLTFKSYTRPLQTAVGSYTEVCELTTGMGTLESGVGAMCIWVDVIHDADYSGSITSFRLSTVYAGAVETRVAVPTNSTGFTGGQDTIDLGVISDKWTTKLVIVRKTGIRSTDWMVNLRVASQSKLVISELNAEKTGWVADTRHRSNYIHQPAGGAIDIFRSLNCTSAEGAVIRVGTGDELGRVDLGNANHGIRRLANNDVDVHTNNAKIKFVTGNTGAVETKMVINEAGDVGIRAGDTPSYTLHVNGNLGVTNGSYFLSSWIFQQAPGSGDLAFTYGISNVKGYISRSVDNGQMNFTGRHRCLVNDCCDDETCGMQGLIAVASNNDYLSMDAGLQRGIDAISLNECLPIVSLATRAKDKRVFGVIGDTEPAERGDTYGAFVTPFEKHAGDSRVYINSVGEGAIWVSDELGVVVSGDFITTGTVPGYGVKQEESSLHNFTVAKVTMDCDFVNILIRKRRLKTRSVLAYRTVMEESTVAGGTTTDFRNGRYVRVTQPDTITMIEKKSMMDVYDETGAVIATEDMAEKEEYTMHENVVDGKGHAVWEDAVDAEGAPIMEARYRMRWLLPDGTLTSEADYVERKAAGETVYRAAFVGCTYHCG